MPHPIEPVVPQEPAVTHEELPTPPPAEPLLPPVPPKKATTAREDMKRAEALNRYLNVMRSRRDTINQIKALESEAMRLNESVIMQFGAGKILRDIYQFTDAELQAAELAAPAEQTDEPKYD